MALSPHDSAADGGGDASESAAAAAPAAASVAAVLKDARLPGAWEPLLRHRSVDVVLLWATAHAVHWLMAQPVEWLVLAAYSVVVLARLRSLRPVTALVWLAAWALADYVVYSLVAPAIAAKTASFMVHSVLVVKLQGCNLRGAALVAIAAAVLVARDSPQVANWYRAVAAHCTGTWRDSHALAQWPRGS